MVSPHGGSGRFASTQTAADRPTRSVEDIQKYGPMAQLKYFGEAVASNVGDFFNAFRDMPEKEKKLAETRLKKAKNDTERAEIMNEIYQGRSYPHKEPMDVQSIDPALVSSQPDVGYWGTEDPAGVDPASVTTQPTPEQMITQEEQLDITPPPQPGDPAATGPAAGPGAPPMEPGGESIKGKLGRLEGEMAGFREAQKEAYGQTEEEYENEERRIRQESQVEYSRSKIKEAEGALSAATEKLSNWDVNPMRAFPNALSKVAAVISVAMGAYAQGLSGGKIPNTALQIINSAIDKDIEAQKLEYNKLKGLVDENRNVYGMAMRMLGDERQADSLARAAAFRTFNAKITSMSKEFGIDEKVFSDKLAMLKLEDNENKWKAELIGRAGSKGKDAVGDKTRADMGQLKSIKNQVASYREMIKERGPEDIPGSWQISQAFFETHGGKMEQKRGLIARQLLMYTDKGRISDKDYEIMLRFIPGVYKSQAAANAMLDGLESMINEIESARWDTMDNAARQQLLKENALSNRGIGHEGLFQSTGEADTHEYWKANREQWRVQEGKK